MATTDDDTEFGKRHQVRILKARLKELLEARDERNRLSALVASLQVEIELVKLERDSARAEADTLTTERNLYRSLLEDKISQRPQYPPPYGAPTTYPDGPQIPLPGYGRRSIFDN